MFVDMQKLANALGDAGRQERSGYHLTLGQLIKLFEQVHGDAIVEFDSGGHPRNAHSYRGYYSDLAFVKSAKQITVKEFESACQKALNKTFEGWKGGDYVMDEKTPLWVSGIGDADSVAITDVLITESYMILKTKIIEF